MSGVTLLHSESDTKPDCTVVFGAGRLEPKHMCRVEIVFELCYYARTGPHSDSEGVDALGYSVDSPITYNPATYLATRERLWRETGSCPDSGFYVAKQSTWLESLPDFFQRGSQHYVVDGRDGYVELIAHSFRWREWIWKDSHREDVPSKTPVFAEGEGNA